MRARASSPRDAATGGARPSEDAPPTPQSFSAPRTIRSLRTRDTATRARFIGGGVARRARSVHGGEGLRRVVLHVRAQMRQVGADRVADHEKVGVHLQHGLPQVLQLRRLERRLVPLPHRLVAALGPHERVLLLVRQVALQRLVAAGGERVDDLVDPVLNLRRDARVAARRERRREGVHPALEPHADSEALHELHADLCDRSLLDGLRVR
mmetsp:Transcript_34224/g.58547  ORF Transcript_34224/g.58547 Transcript_34224/m.58547 type:complete len:210 (-) Transcript_34224:275-904(-)